MIADPEFVQTAIIRNHLTASERLFKETGYEKEHVLEAYQRYDLDKEKRVRAFHSYLKIARAKENNRLGIVLEHKLKTEVAQLIETQDLRMGTANLEVISYNFEEYCFIGQIASKYALLRLQQTKIINDVRRRRVLEDLAGEDSIDTIQVAQLHLYADFVIDQSKKEQGYFEAALELIWKTLGVSDKRAAELYRTYI